MTTKVNLHFTGPFSWEGAPGAPSLHEDVLMHLPGIYMTTVQLPDGFLPHYIGETGKSFAARLADHHRERMAARYHIWSAPEFARGVRELIWSGIWDRPEGGRNTKAECHAQSERLRPYAMAQLKIKRYFFAPLSCDKRTRQRVEAALADLIKVQSPVPTFFSPGVRYLRKKKDEMAFECDVSSQAPILGLPENFEA